MEDAEVVEWRKERIIANAVPDYAEADAAAERYRRLAAGEPPQAVYVTEDGRPEEWAKALHRHCRDVTKITAAYQQLRGENAMLSAPYPNDARGE